MRALLFLLLVAAPLCAGDFKSTADGKAVKVTFKNGTLAPVEYIWVSTEGKEESYGTLAPAASFEQETYAGHAWLFKSAGKVIGQYLATEAPVQVYALAATPAPSPSASPSASPSPSPAASPK